MLNVKTLTNTLSRMELPELHDYATLHKNDPYIVTLALSIANQKKQMKAGQAGQAGMQPQPKVVDQELSQMMAPPPQQGMAPPQQQMLPEESGIGQLPAPNMQRLAEGGIVAFDDGGEVPSFAGPAGSYVDPLAAYLKQLGITPQEFLAKTGPEQQQIRATATAAKPLVPPPAVPVAQAAAAAEASAAKPTGGLSKLLGPLALAYELMRPDNKKQEQASYPYKLGAQSAVDEQGTSVAAAKESAEAYAARKIKEFEATLPAGQKLSPEARNKETDRLIAEKVAAELIAKRQPVDPTGQNPVDPIKSASLKTDKGYTTPTVAGQAVVGQDGSMPPAASVTTVKPPAAAAPSADDDFMAGIDKLLKGSQTASNMGPMTKLDAKRYSLTPEQLSNLTPADYAAAITSAMPADPTASPLDARQQTLNTANVAARQKYANDLEKQFKEQGLAFTDTLNKLTSKEKRVQTMEDNQLGMSMFEAGLAMMAGESPYAMVNIGKGAQVGTKKYMEIQDKVEGARDKIDDAKMKIEEFRRNEANMNAREQRLARKDVDDAVSTGAQAMLNLAQQEYGLNRQQAISFVTNSQLAQQFNVGEKNRAAAQNQSTAASIDTAYANMANQRRINADNKNMQLELARLEAKYRASNPAAGSLGFFREIGKGDPVKGMKIYSENLGPESKGEEAILLAWSKASEPEKMIARKNDPMGSAVKDQKLKERLLQGSISDKPAGALLDQPR